MDVYPCLTYRDLKAGLAELEAAFGGEVVVMERDGNGVRAAAVAFDGGMVMVQPELPEQLHGNHAGQGWVYVIVADPEAHRARAVAAGANALGPVHSAFEGRQRGYSARDREGNLWSFATQQPEDDRPLPASPVELARSVIASSRYMTLATADASGRPWASPIFFAPGAPGEFLWVSRPTSEHSVNLEARPEVSIAIFDSRQRIGTARGVYVIAHAERTEDGIEAFSRGAERWGGDAWDQSSIEGDAELRLYRAVATGAWVMDSANDPRGDFRVPVDL